MGQSIFFSILFLKGIFNLSMASKPSLAAETANCYR